MIGCDLFKSDKNIGWRVGNIFEAADLGDVLAHPCITRRVSNRAVRFGENI